MRTQVRVIRDLPRVSIFSQFQYLSFKDKTSDRNIRTGLTALRNPSLSAPCCVCACVSVCMSLVNLQPRKPEGRWLPASPRTLFFKQKKLAPGQQTLRGDFRRTWSSGPKLSEIPKSPVAPRQHCRCRSIWALAAWSPSSPLRTVWGEPVRWGLPATAQSSGFRRVRPEPGSADPSLHSSPRALGSPVQKEVVKNGRPAGRSGEGQRPSSWLIGARPRLGGRLRPRQCAPELGAGKARRDCYRIS